jgi:hypothetical protein
MALKSAFLPSPFPSLSGSRPQIVFAAHSRPFAAHLTLSMRAHAYFSPPFAQRAMADSETAALLEEVGDFDEELAQLVRGRVSPELACISPH